jgi:PIN domain nuclease of toxin-antitoxin system
MSVTLIDASALLAFLWEEPGWESVQAALDGDCECLATNWSEVATKVFAKGGSWPDAEAALAGLGLRIRPVGRDDAVDSARLWESDKTLSLADRLCLAVGMRQGWTILTAARAWTASSPLVRSIR